VYVLVWYILRYGLEAVLEIKGQAGEWS
jgi:hypothetical protein